VSLCPSDSHTHQTTYELIFYFGTVQCCYFSIWQLNLQCCKLPFEYLYSTRRPYNSKNFSSHHVFVHRTARYLSTRNSIIKTVTICQKPQYVDEVSQRYREIHVSKIPSNPLCLQQILFSEYALSFPAYTDKLAGHGYELRTSMAWQPCTLQLSGLCHKDGPLAISKIMQQAPTQTQYYLCIKEPTQCLFWQGSTEPREIGSVGCNQVFLNYANHFYIAIDYLVL